MEQDFFNRIASDTLSCIGMLLVFCWVLLCIKEMCKDAYGFCKYRYVKYTTKLVEHCQIMDKHDQLAEMNSSYAKVKKVKPSDAYLKRALPKSKKDSSRKLNGCVMCKQPLLQLKQSGMSLKYAECGHVFCLTCANQLHDEMKARSKLSLARYRWPCPTCAQPIKRDGIIRMSNLYL